MVSITVVTARVVLDDIFLPREVENARMDDFEREIEEFKRSVVVRCHSCMLYSVTSVAHQCLILFVGCQGVKKCKFMFTITCVWILGPEPMSV